MSLTSWSERFMNWTMHHSDRVRLVRSKALDISENQKAAWDDLQRFFVPMLEELRADTYTEAEVRDAMALYHQNMEQTVFLHVEMETLLADIKARRKER